MGKDLDVTEEASRDALGLQKDVGGVWLSYLPGERIAGKYQLIKMLDHGGMGVVWVAHHLGLDIHVALKLVRPEVESTGAAERLVVEAQAAARLRHPAIVQVLDVGRTDEGNPFLVMELLDGECLADVLDREERLDAITALRVILPIAGALEALHAKGIVHRDVKPENIFLSRDDAGRWQPKLIDFGLARIDSRSRAGRITQRGTVVGTPVYLSPERIRGEEADARDDVWALCVVLYLMVTAEFPFDGDNAINLFVSLAKGEPSSLASQGVNDPALWEILRRGLSSRGARWQSMDSLSKALTRELLKRGATRDIAGLALRSTATADTEPPPPAASPRADGPAEERRLAWQILTTRMTRPTSAELLRARRPRTPVTEVPTAPVRSSVPPPLGEERPGARLTPVLALGLVSLGVVLGLIAGVLIGRSSAAAAAPPVTVTAPRK